MEESSRAFEANLFKFQTLCGFVFLLCSTFTTTSTPALILSTVEPPWLANQFLCQETLLSRRVGLSHVAADHQSDGITLDKVNFS